MSGRFSHLKNTKKPRSLNDFIEGANEEATKVTKRTPKKDELLLVISGRLDHSSCKSPLLLYIKEELAEDIDKHCSGNKQVVINYLIKMGLESLRKQKEMVIEREQ